jgi:hypothetical protein
MKLTVKEFILRIREGELEGNYLLDLMKYLKKWLMSFNGSKGL